jgi:spermidine synthase
LGFGCGTHARVLSHLIDPAVELSVVGIELDPAVVELGRSHMGLIDSPNTRLLLDMDARIFADHSQEVFDLIIVDCYSSQSFVPPHVASVEFFTSLRDRLDFEGFLALNLFGYGARDPVIEAIAATASRGLESDVILCWIPETANYLAYAARSIETPHPSKWTRSEERHDLKTLWLSLLASQRIVRVRADDRSTTILRDDDGRLDRLQANRLATRARSVLTVGD